MERKKSTRSKWVTTDKQMTTDSKKRNLSGKKKASHSTEESKEILISEVDKLSLSIQIESCKRKLRRKVQLYKNAENEKITHEHNYKQEVLTKQDAVHHLNCALNDMSAESMFCKNQLEAMEQKYQEMLLEKELFAEEKDRVKNLSDQKAKLELKLSDVDKCSAQIPELCLGLSRIEIRSSSLNEELKQNLVQVDHITSKLIERAKRELLKKSRDLSRIFELNVFTLPPEHQMVLSEEITTSRLIQNAFEFHQQLQFRNSHLDKSIISMENDIFYAARSEQKLLTEVAVAEKDSSQGLENSGPNRPPM